MGKKITEELLKILACPISKASLIYDKKNQELVCKESKLAYQVKDEIAIMNPDEARKLE